MTSLINDDYYYHLPPEILLKIFSFYIETEGPLQFIRNVSPVCKLWRDLGTDSLLWREVSWKSMSHNYSDLLKIGKRGILAFARNLDLSYGLYHDSPYFHPPKLNGEKLLQIIGYCHNVESLDISYNEVMTETVMQAVAEKFPRMKKFVMKTESSCHGSCSVLHAQSGVVPLRRIEPIFKYCGKTLTCLYLSCRFSSKDEVVSKISQCCPRLEKLHFLNLLRNRRVENLSPFPMCEIQSGCPKLQVLSIRHCKIGVSNTEKLKGFRDMKFFRAILCDFQGLDVIEILNRSTALRTLSVISCCNLKLDGMSRIPSDRVEFLSILDIGEPLEPLEKAVRKWSRVLKDLRVRSTDCNLTGIAEALMEDNPDPAIERIQLIEYVDLPIIKEMLCVCSKLKWMCAKIKSRNEYLKIDGSPKDTQKFLKSMCFTRLV